MSADLPSWTSMVNIRNLLNLGERIVAYKKNCLVDICLAFN